MSGPNNRVCLVVLPAYFRFPKKHSLLSMHCHCHDSAIKNEYRLYLQKKNIRVYHTFQNEPV